MDIERTLRIVLRRWYVFLPVLALAVVGMIVGGRSAGVEHQVAMAWLTTPPTRSDSPPNPFGSADQASEAVVAIVNRSEMHQALEKAGLAVDFEAKSVERNALINISLSSAVADHAQRGGTALVKLTQDELLRLQTAHGVAPADTVKIIVLDSPDVTETNHSSQRKVQAVVGLVGAVAAVLTSVLFDDLLLRWARRRSAPRPTARR